MSTELVAHDPEGGSAQVVRDLPAVDVADLLLGLASERGTLSVAIEAGLSGHEVACETVAGPRRLLTLLGDLGDAVAARLALLAGLDPARAGGQLGRLAIEVGDEGSEVQLLVSSSALGLGVEIRRLVGRRDLAGGAGAIASGAASPDRRGAYRLLEKIGEGGFGEVFRAKHVALDKTVAVKVLRPAIAADPARAAELLREGRLASRARSASIVDVTDFGISADGRTYLVMEHVAWPTLARVLEAGPLPPLRAVAIARNVAAALGEAHAQGVVHRDVKPSNVFVGPGDAVKVCDFGIARLSGAGARGPERGEPNTSGTPHYMAPEQARGIDTDERSDLYALGCVLYEMLTGGVPYQGTSAVAVLVAHLEAPIPTASSPFGALPGALHGTLMRVLQKDPGERHAGAAELVQELEAAAGALRRKGWQTWLAP